MKEKLLDFLKIPSDICEAYWRETLEKNRISVLAICVIIFGAEIYNIARVLFWSPSGLGTFNNRIYFGMYCILLVLAALVLVLQHLLRKAPPRVQWGVQYGFILLTFLWHIGLNVYDLMGTPYGETTIFTTAILGLGFFIQMPGFLSLLFFGLGYSIFFLLAASLLDTGAKVNLTITFVVALAVSLTCNYHAVVSLRQRREIRQMNARLQELIQKDPLTGLLNKVAFQSCAEQMLSQSSQKGKLTLLMMDLDNFKKVNDTYGHLCGDYVLMEAALKLRSVFCNAVGIGRIGGDEFAVLLSGTSQESPIKELAGQIIQEISEIRWQNQPAGVGCSIGICRNQGCLATYEQLYQEADRALYKAKGQGKGRFYCVEGLPPPENAPASR